MKPASWLLTTLGVLTLSSLAMAQTAPPPVPEAPESEPAMPGPPPPLPPAQQQEYAPGASQPGMPPPQAMQPAAPVAGAPPGQGQWVNTQQYGWVYAPFASPYSYAPRPGVAYSYVYSAGPGWRWVLSPWVWGGGPRPYFTAGVQFYPWYRPRFWGPGYRWSGVVVGRPWHGGYGRRIERGPGPHRRW